MKGGEERNKKIFDANLLLAQSRIYRNKPLEALDGLNYVFANMRNDKRIPLARIYQGLAYAKMEDKIQTNILSEKPSVKLFNFWKLHLFIKHLKSNAS